MDTCRFVPTPASVSLFVNTPTRVAAMFVVKYLYLSEQKMLQTNCLEKNKLQTLCPTHFLQNVQCWE